MIKLKYVVFHHLFNGVHTSLNLETLNALKKKVQQNKKKTKLTSMTLKKQRNPYCSSSPMGCCRKCC